MAAVLRASVCALTCLAYVVSPDHSAGGWVLYGGLASWAIVRFATAGVRGLVVADAALLLAFLVAKPEVGGLVGAADGLSGRLIVPLTVSFALELPGRASLPLVAALLAATLWGTDWDGPLPVVIMATAIALSWAITVSTRALMLRGARVNDAAEADAIEARREANIATERRRFEREQWAMLHDTAASTLLMVSQGAVADRDRLAEQAARDLRAIEELAPDNQVDDTVDLRDVLEQICAEFSIEIDLHAPDEIPQPRFIARTIGAATREALTNVERHAHATQVRVEANLFSVTITDNGIGYTFIEDRPGPKFGVRNSIIGRMHRIGGAASIRAGATRGSVVELTWRPRAAHDLAPSETSLLPTQVAGSFNLGIAGIGVVILLARFCASVVGGERSVSALELFLLGVVFVSGVVAAVLVFRPRWWATLVTSGFVIVAGPAFVFGLPADEVLLVHNWLLAATAWVLTALLFQEPWVVSFGAMAALWVLEFGAILIVAPSRDSFAGCLQVLAATATTQVVSVIVLGYVARVAHLSRRADEERRMHAEVAEVKAVLTNDYDERCRRLTATLTPLLTAFADRSLDPWDAEVQARAGVEAARLRLLFAQAEVFEQALVRRLQPAMDRAGERGVVVTVDIGPSLPLLSDEKMRVVAATVGTLLDAARTSVRLVVTSVDGALRLSVVGDLDLDATPLPDAPPDFEIVTAVDGRSTWVQLRERSESRAAVLSLAN